MFARDAGEAEGGWSMWAADRVVVVVVGGCGGDGCGTCGRGARR